MERIRKTMETRYRKRNTVSASKDDNAWINYKLDRCFMGNSLWPIFEIMVARRNFGRCPLCNRRTASCVNPEVHGIQKTGGNGK